MRRFLFSPFALIALMSFGCADRAHLTESHGRAYRQALAQQAVNPNAGAPQKSTQGLDSQEASIIVGSYHKGLAPKDATVQDQSMVTSGSPARAANAATYMPPPSVPDRK